MILIIYQHFSTVAFAVESDLLPFEERWVSPVTRVAASSNEICKRLQATRLTKDDNAIMRGNPISILIYETPPWRTIVSHHPFFALSHNRWLPSISKEDILPVRQIRKRSLLPLPLHILLRPPLLLDHLLQLRLLLLIPAHVNPRHNHTTSHLHNRQNHNRRFTRDIPWRVFRQENVCADYTTQPEREEREGVDGVLLRVSTSIRRIPRVTEGKARSREILEQLCELQHAALARVLHGCHNDHADEGWDGEKEDERHSVFQAVGEPAACYDSEAADCRSRHAEKERFAGGPAEGLGDDVVEGAVATVGDAGAHDDEELDVVSRRSSKITVNSF